MKTLLEAILSKNGFQLSRYRPLSGGDINAVYLLETTPKLVVKINDKHRYPGMFSAEAKGLKLLKSSDSFLIPEVIDTGEIGDFSYLLMTYIESGKADGNFAERFAEALATLHRCTHEKFGLGYANYIGSLPQYNAFCDTADALYITQRLEPQFKLASEKGFPVKPSASFYENISDEIPHEKPSLIHGDLWSGNYLISRDGNPVLIDPAVSYASREMDLAMMQLFGGFDNAIYKNYHAIFPLEEGWQKRVDIWQLYYLLVHLNLFGSSYLSAVKTIINRYA